MFRQLNLERMNKDLPGENYTLGCCRTGSFNKISFMKGMWGSEKAIPLLTIAKHLPYFSPCALWRKFYLTGKYLRTMEAFVSCIDLQLVFDSVDMNHYGTNYVISAQISDYEGSFKVRTIIPL